MLSYELTRLDKLCRVKGLFLYTCVVLPRKVPATCEGRGLSLHRATKINSPRSWQNGTDDDVSLLELFNTACFIANIDRRASDVRLLRYMSLPVFENRSFVVS